MPSMSGIDKSIAAAARAKAARARRRICPLGPERDDRAGVFALILRSGKGRLVAGILYRFDQVLRSGDQGSKTTRAVWVMRLTSAPPTPGVCRKARSTWDWQAAHDIPRTGIVTVGRWLSRSCSTYGGTDSAIWHGYLSTWAEKPALPSPAIRLSIRLSLRDVPRNFTRAAPSRTSSTSAPGTARSDWVTRRMHAPQCIPSMRKLTSDIQIPPTPTIVSDALQRGFSDSCGVVCWRLRGRCVRAGSGSLRREPSANRRDRRARLRDSGASGR